ncbi:MAG: 16S rRNA (guanine(966)-N(2))-methyltransferase RsmD [Pseudomonadota bacterium]
MAGRAARDQFRIIGGRWRGRKLNFDDRPGLRPTPDRVRETLFNWLAPVIHGARALDLYAGTGALGLEALSRGAAEATLVERDRAAVSALKRNAAALDGSAATVVSADVTAWLGTAVGPFDLVFADPPFGSDLLPGLCTLLAERDLLASGGRLYVEYDRHRGFEPPTSWQTLRHKSAGQVGFALLTAARGR